MKALIPASMLAALLAAAPAGAATPPPADAAAADSHAALERQLEDAHRRLEEAAKQVAELSMKLTPDMDQIHMMIDGHHHPMIGVQLGESRPGGGVAIASVSPGSAAADAGLVSGDVIISVNGRKVANAKEVAEELHKLPPETAAKIERSRAGAVASVSVTPRLMDPRLRVLLDDHLSGLHDLDVGMHDLMMQQVHHGMGGWGELELAEVSPDLGRYFGTDKGVLVVKASPAFAGKLRDGDVILSIGERETRSASQALRILRSYEPRETVTLALERDRKPLKVELTMPEHGGHPPPPHAMPPAPAAPPAPPPPPAPPSSSSTTGAETM